MRNYTLAAFILLLLLTTACSNPQADKPTDDNRKDYLLAVIHERKSVRKYSDAAVSDAQIDTLLRAAMAAPSSRNVQPWKFYVVTNKAIMQQFADSLPTKIFPNAQAVIVVCGDNTLKVEEPAQAFNWSLDCSAATQNLLLAAEAMGLGAVWTGVYPYDKRMSAVKNILNLPENIIPLSAIPIGYPEQMEKPKQKYDAEKIIFVR